MKPAEGPASKTAAWSWSDGHVQDPAGQGKARAVEDCYQALGRGGRLEEFLTGIRHGPESTRVLAAVLFTDIVGSTEQAGRLGDRRGGSC
jgi:class 3 adenylate cyclase